MSTGNYIEKLLFLSSSFLKHNGDKPSFIQSGCDGGHGANTINTNTSSSSSLTLYQLISVHESLLSSIQMQEPIEEDQKTDSHTFFGDDDSDVIRKLVQPFFLKGNSKAVDLCTEILLQQQGREHETKIKDTQCYNDQDILLIVQYLLRLNRMKIIRESHDGNPDDNSLQVVIVVKGLKDIVFPLLVASPHYSASLRDVIMEAAFTTVTDVPFLTRHIMQNRGENTADMVDSTTSCHDAKQKQCPWDVLQEIEKFLVLMFDSTKQLLQTPLSNNSERIVSATTNTSTSSSTNTLGWIHTVVEMSSRIMTRMLNLPNPCVETHQHGRNIILSYMHQLMMAILEAVCFYSVISSTEHGIEESDIGSSLTKSLKHVPLVVNGKTTTLMRSITALLLPAMLEQGEQHDCRACYEDCVNDLWDFIWNIMDPDPSRINGDSQLTVHNANEKKRMFWMNRRKCRSWKDVSFSVASALLCVMAEKVHSLPLAVPGHRQVAMRRDVGADEDGIGSYWDVQDKISSSRAIVIQQPTFWNFLQISLNSGAAGIMGGDGEETRGMKGGGRFTSNMASNPYQERGMEDADVEQLIRRRAIYILRCAIDSEYEKVRNFKGPRKEVFQAILDRISMWKKYTSCFEALEMEVEAHLVDQVWGTVTELCLECAKDFVPDSLVATDQTCNESYSLSVLPRLTWNWIGALFSRVLLSDSPTLRKLGLFRLFMGSAGISVREHQEISIHDEMPMTNQKDTRDQASKRKKKAKKMGKAKSLLGAPPSIMSPNFMLFCLIQSYDSLVNVGTGVNFDVDGKTDNHDLAQLFPSFLTTYIRSLFKDARKLQTFMEGMMSERFVTCTRARTLVMVFDAVIDAWKHKECIKVNIRVCCIEQGVAALQHIFERGSVVLDFRQSLTLNVSKLLAYSSVSKSDKMKPDLVLKVLALFPAPEEVCEPTEFQKESDKYLALWLDSLGESWTVNVGSAFASSFISGDLLPYSKGTESSLVAPSALERQIGSSIAKLCALCRAKNTDSPSALLWPAINKGLSSGALIGQQSFHLSHDKAQQSARAIILLEYGCKERILGGFGHGDLVIDKNGSMMPPAPGIELLVSRALNFTLEQLKLVSVCNYDESHILSDVCGGRSTKSGEFANHFGILINQLNVFKNSYPSSAVLESYLNRFLKSTLDDILDMKRLSSQQKCSMSTSIKMIKYMATGYGVLSLGAGFSGKLLNQEEKEESAYAIDVCSTILTLKFSSIHSEGTSIATWQVKAMTSLFEHSRWGALMYLIPMAYKGELENSLAIQKELHNQIMNVAIKSVNACPVNALPVLFEAVCGSAREILKRFGEESSIDSHTHIKDVARIIEALFAVIKDTSRSSTRAYMLNVTCSLIFSPKLMKAEFDTLQQIKSKGGKPNLKLDAPILSAFRKMMDEAGVSKPHISKYILSYAVVGWLGTDTEKDKMGLAAIPYRQDIAKLLIHKGEKVEKTAAHQEGLVKSYDEGDFATLPEGVPSSSIVRGFLMVFLSKLPDPNSMNKDVLIKFCHYLIFWLLDNICVPVERSGKALLTTGSTEYVQKIRAWQSLCMLHRFVSPGIATDVLKKVFKAMDQLLHGQIRYWIEIFTIQVARKNPDAFLSIFQGEIQRCDISQQHMSSLMILGGNLLAGRYSASFLKSIVGNKSLVLQDIIAGTVPWLSSTQGFCRAVAQLLTHKLIPLAKPSDIQHQDAFFLETIYNFLDNNPDMTRLRQKQSAFFDSYDVDYSCTPEGMFSFALDDGEESNPPHLAEVLKKSLIEIYDHSKSNDSPEWKQLVNEINAIDLGETHFFDNTQPANQEEEALVNFQRKILPMDTLNLTLQEHRQTSLRNAAGRTRQSLIVCASLIDKVTNLAGLTRTAEIFAAEKIVVPDAKVKKMDNFKSISVGAEDWVEIEECRESDLLSWLKARKDEGYSIIGIEQTSSSQCLSTVQFEPKSVLLLGKEKEGIPVQYLQMVDKCVEIPQLGIIRSLNVHVSGAISIWEYTKQQMVKRKE